MEDSVYHSERPEDKKSSLNHTVLNMTGLFLGVVLVVGAGFAGVSLLVSEGRKESRKELTHYEHSLKAIGIAPERVIRDRKFRRDIDRDGNRDYRIYIPNSDGTYSTRYILGR